VIIPSSVLHTLSRCANTSCQFFGATQHRAPPPYRREILRRARQPFIRNHLLMHAPSRSTSFPACEPHMSSLNQRMRVRVQLSGTTALPHFEVFFIIW